MITEFFLKKTMNNKRNIIDSSNEKEIRGEIEIFF